MPRSTHFALIASAFVLLGFVHPASAQTIQVQQNQLVFNAQPGSSSAFISFPISSTGGPAPYSVTFTQLSPSGGQSWFTVTQPSGTLPVSLLIAANAVNLAPGVYSGLFTINVTGAINSPLVIPVTFNVGVSGNGLLTASPASLTFNAALNGVTPNSQLVSISTSAPGTSYLASISTFTGGGWLQVSPGGGTAPTIITVSVVTAGLQAGNYQGLITLSVASGPPLLIPVSLNVGGTASLTASASSLQFFYQSGGLTPATQQLSFTTSDGSRVGFTLTPTTTNGGNWLFLTQNSGNTPQTVTVGANINGLAPATYTGNIAVFAAGAINPTLNVPVTLIVSSGNLVTIGTPPMPFNFQTGGPLPGSQAVTIGSTGAALSFSVTTQTQAGTGNWLIVGPASGTTPVNLAVGVNPLNLTAGSYTGAVTITAPGAANSPQSFNVVFNVNTTSAVSVSPPALSYVFQVGSTTSVPSRPLNVITSAASVANLTVATTSCGSGWLLLSQGTISTPGSVVVGVNATGLASPQVCNGTITVSVNGVATAAQVPVTLIISNTHLLNIVQSGLSFSAPYQGTITDPQTIQMTSTDSTPVQYFTNATTATGGSWISFGPSAGTTPTPITVSANPFGLNPGTYSGSVVINSAGFPAPQTVPVTFTVSPATTTIVSPTALSFSQAVGAAPPPSQAVNVSSSTGNYNFTVTTSTSNLSNWLQVAPIGGTTPAAINVSVNGSSLPPGIYNGTVGISAPGASNDPVIIPVTLVISAARTISATVASLTFNYEIGSLTNPPSQPIGVTSTGGAVTVGTVATTNNNSGNWLSVSPASVNTPASLDVSVNPSGLAAGTYGGQVSVTAPGVLGSPILVPVTLVVAPTPPPSVTTVASAASGSAGVISPGAIITLKGSAMGPGIPATFKVNAAGGIDTALGGTRILIDGIAAPLLYVSQKQVNAMAPYEIANRSAVSVQAEFQGQRSQTATVSVIPAAPGIFTVDSTGTGPGAILNQDGSLNSASNPAAAGSVVQVYATGEGVTNPPGVTGSVTGSDLKKPVAEVSATIGGLPADVLYAGSAPQSVVGLFQVNLKVPAGAGTGALPIVITVGGSPSQTGVTVAVQ